MGTRDYLRRIGGGGVVQREGSHASIKFKTEAQRYNGQWTTSADSFIPENDVENSIRSCTDSGPEPEVKPANVTRFKKKKETGIKYCDWSEDKNF
eukprot:11296871-Ditylum_brightwellii.AAC.1